MSAIPNFILRHHMQQSIYQYPMNEHSTWVEDLEGYISHQSLAPFEPPLSNDPFSRSSGPIQPDLSTMNGSAGYSNGFTSDDAVVWTPRPMFSMMPISPPTLSMPYLPMRLNSDPTPLPFSIEEEDESQPGSVESHSMALMTELESGPSDRIFGIHSRFLSPLRRSLSSLSSIYGRHVHRRGSDNTIPQKKRLKRALSLKNMSEKVKERF
ncbi:hypothetical protein BJ165DRAFT_1524558 [Panaeolus papilionaceus]|nr:hypothetical protein BJ165DRAFT_1524558 [Panaeolus papilionaceus]